MLRCRDTAAVVLRVLTARSVQVLLMQLQETDVFVAQYMNNFAAENPPSQDKVWARQKWVVWATGALSNRKTHSR